MRLPLPLSCILIADVDNDSRLYVRPVSTVLAFCAEHGKVTPRYGPTPIKSSRQEAQVGVGAGGSKFVAPRTGRRRLLKIGSAWSSIKPRFSAAVNNEHT